MKRTMLVLALLLASTGCATLFSDGADTIRILSKPDGAQVYIDGMPVGQTPIDLQMDRDTFATHYVTLRAEGFQALRFPLQKTLALVSLLNSSSLLSWGIDALTGNMMAYDPRSYYFELLPQYGGPPPPGYSAPSTPEQWQRRRFVMSNYRGVLRDIARQQGPNLDAVLGLYGVDRDRAASFTQGLAAAMPTLAATRYPHHLFNRLETIACGELRASACVGDQPFVQMANAENP